MSLQPILSPFLTPAPELKSPRSGPKETPEEHRVEFLHPGYPDGENVLLILPAYDSKGIHYGTAHTACAIIANSRWNGFLSTTRDSGGRCCPPQNNPDAVLASGQYYFCIEGETDYPVVPSFDHYKFPCEIPSSWFHATVEHSLITSVIGRDVTCRLTNSSLSLEIAHIIPVAQQLWWVANKMYSKTANPHFSVQTDCPENLLLLRRDAHKLWDDHWFSIVPKAGKLVAHVLYRAKTNELYEEYHNLEMQPLKDLSTEFLFARFALAILSEQNMIAKQGSSRRLVVREGTEYKTKTFTRAQCDARFGKPGGSRNQSTRKRQRSRTSTTPADDDFWFECYPGMGGSSDDDDLEPRGRPQNKKRITASCSSTSSSAGTSFRSRSRNSPSHVRIVGSDHEGPSCRNSIVGETEKAIA